MTKTFTTWSDLLDQLKDALVNYQPGIMMYQVKGKMVQYSTFKELKNLIEYVERQVAIESGKKAPRKLVFRSSGGRY